MFENRPENTVLSGIKVRLEKQFEIFRDICFILPALSYDDIGDTGISKFIPICLYSTHPFDALQESLQKIVYIHKNPNISKGGLVLITAKLPVLSDE